MVNHYFSSWIPEQRVSIFYIKTGMRRIMGNADGGDVILVLQCNPYEKKPSIISFVDGTEITTVFHEGTVTVRGHEVKMQFRLIIGWSSDPPTRPKNFLGASFGRKVPQESILVQLFLNKIITEKTVSICSPDEPELFGGDLILGPPAPWQCPNTGPTTTVLLKSAWYFGSALSSLGLKNSAGRAFMQNVRNVVTIYDSGASGIALYNVYFDFLFNKIREVVQQDSHLDVYFRLMNRVWYIDQKGFDYLPKLEFEIGDAETRTTILIPPNRYTDECRQGWCMVRLSPTRRRMVFLGRPFFTTYYSSFTEKENGQKILSLAAYEGI